jgi:hypothetical protein
MPFGPMSSGTARLKVPEESFPTTTPSTVTRVTLVSLQAPLTVYWLAVVTGGEGGGEPIQRTGGCVSRITCRVTSVE